MGKADLLPMGSLVYLKGGDMKLMIIAGDRFLKINKLYQTVRI